MTHKARHEYKKTQHLDASASPPPAAKSSPAWKPQSCGLSRAELREIVAQVMG
jgi:hypothetical protein